MAKDFSSKQIRVSQIIASGGIAVPGRSWSPGLVVYSASNASDLSGGIPANLLADLSSDVFVFVSGSKDGVVRGEGVTLFGGDVVVSGTLYAEKQVIEVDESVTGSMTIQGSLFVSASTEMAGGLTVNKDLGPTAGDGFAVKGTTESKDLFSAKPHLTQVLVLSGGSDKSFDESTAGDVSFYVSGSIDSRGGVEKGTAVFGGDMYVSGAVFIKDDLTLEDDLIVGDDASFSSDGAVISFGVNSEVTLTHVHDEGLLLSDDAGVGTTKLMLGDSATFIHQQADGELGIDADSVINITAPTVDIDASSEVNVSGQASVGGDLLVADYIKHVGDSDTFFRFPGADAVSISAGGKSLIEGSDGSGVVINELGDSAIDLRVESDNKTHAIFVDSSADQVLILSGGDDKSYNEASAGDVSFYVSGSIDSRAGSQKGTSVFGGDLYVSGNLYSDELTVADDLTVGDELVVGGHLFVAEYIKHTGDDNTTVRFQNDKVIITAGGTDLIKADKTENTISINPENSAINTVIKGNNKTGIAVHGVVDSVLILSGGAAPSFDEGIAADVSLYVSGAVGDRGNPAVRGTSLFGGDMFISGTLIVSGGASDKGSWGTISGSIFETSDGLSYITAGSNVVVTSGSNGQIEISATAGVDGSGVANRVAFWSDSDTLTSDADLNFNGSNLGLTGSAVGPNSALDVDRNYAGTTSNSTLTSHAGASGILLDYDVTGVVASGQYQKHNPLWIKYDQSVPSHVGIVQGTGIKVEMTGSTSGVQSIDGISVIVNDPGSLAGDAARGISINAPAGWVDGTANGSHIRCFSQADISDYFDISVGVDGISQLTTVDSAAANAHLNLKPDGKLLIHSGGAAVSSNESTYADTCFFVSGTVGSRGTVVAGTAVFGGDIYSSGTIYSSLGISGSITNLTDGTSYIAGGLNVTVTSASNGQISIAAAAGGGAVDTYDNAANNRVITSVDGTTINGEANLTFDGSTLTVSGDTGLNGAVTVNEAGANKDFRVESENNTHALFIDANVDVVSLGSSGAPGTDIIFFVSGAKSDNSLGNRISGGATLLGGDVVVSGAIYAGGRIINEGDPDTYIRPRNDEWQFVAGGKNLIQLKEDESTISFNQDNEAIHTLIKTDTKMAFAAGTPLGAGKDQVLIMSGGAATSFNEATADDVLVYISGSRTQIGGPGANSTGRHTRARTNTIFGGDVVFSGSIYGAGAIDPFGTTAVHLAANVLQVDALTQIALCDNNGGAPGFGPANATDTFFSVSGSIGSINSATVKGAAVFGGDGVISGSFRTGGQIHITTHKSAPGNNSAAFVRFDSIGVDGSAGANNKMVTPYNGKLIKVVARGSDAPGSTVIGFHRNTDGNAQLDGTAVQNITVNMASANTAYTFNFTGVSDWGPGDIIGLKFNPDSDPGNLIITAIWEYNNI